MVMSKTSVIAPLETIYEESGSFIASTNNSYPRIQNHVYPNGSINGLISARSIPTVNFHQQRAVQNPTKPPIEVRFRDGSKRYIPPSSSQNAMMMSRRKFTDSSDADLSSNTMSTGNYKHFFNANTTNIDTERRKPPVVITIITVNDIKRAGFTPTDTSSPETISVMSTPSLSNSASNFSQTLSSPTFSNSTFNRSQPTSSMSQPISSLSQRIPTQQSILSQAQSQSQSQSTVTVSTGRTRKHFHKVSFAPLPPMTPVQSLMQSTTNQSRTNTALQTNLPRISPHQSISSSNSRNSTPSQSGSVDTNSVASTVNSNSKSTNPSLQIILSNNTHNRTTPLNTTQKVNQGILPNTNVAIVGGSRSAFRPFLRQMRLNQKSFPITKRAPLNIQGRIYRPTQQQQQQMLSFVQSYHDQQQQQHPTMPLTNITNIPVNSNAVQNEETSNYQDQSISSSNNINNSFSFRNLMNIPTNSNQNLSLTPGPSMNWINITSNSIYDIPKLARAYASIPLRIDLPVVSPHSNQKALVHHDTGLERRLLNAGLSPETVALYERILDVAQYRPMSGLSSLQTFGQDPYSSLL
ncbi:hypothetical protein I4U23_025600 [Adineta vaga]|nr:hypothetical protein I4U23_025600 [Adineta vaga]